MFIRPRTLVPLVVVAFVLIGAAACSNGTASVNDRVGNDGGEETSPSAERTCEATATVNDTTYHVVQAVSRDYTLKATVQYDGIATDCSGDGDRPMTFHAIPQVDPAWALCGMVDGEWRVFLADDVGQVPADSALARIVVGD